MVVLANPNPAGALFVTVLVVAFTCKLLEVIHVVSDVVTANVFFIDWEQVVVTNISVFFSSSSLLVAWCLQCFDAVGWAAGRASGL